MKDGAMIFEDERSPRQVWVNWELDDQELSLIAYRVYGHILRRAGKKDHAYPSYQTIGDTCFSADSNSSRTRRDWAMEAVKELCDRQFLRKTLRHSVDQKKFQSNLYRITDKDDWLPPSRSTATTPSRSTATTPSRSTATTPSRSTATTPSRSTATESNSKLSNSMLSNSINTQYPDRAENISQLGKVEPCVLISELPEGRTLGFQVPEEQPVETISPTKPTTANEQSSSAIIESLADKKKEAEKQPEENIIPLASNLVDSNSAESIASPEIIPVPKPPSLPASADKLASLAARFAEGKAKSAANPKHKEPELVPEEPTTHPTTEDEQRQRMAKLMGTQNERYKAEQEDLDEGSQSSGVKAQEGGLEVFIPSLLTDCDQGGLLALIGDVPESINRGQAPTVLVERIWETYRQYRPNTWHQPVAIDQSRSLRANINNLWRAMADSSRSFAENCAEIEAAFRDCLMYLHSKPWFTTSGFSNKNLNYLLTCRPGEAPVIAKYADSWNELQKMDREATNETLRRLASARRQFTTTQLEWRDDTINETPLRNFPEDFGHAS